jgi:hypothetical protein
MVSTRTFYPAERMAGLEISPATWFDALSDDMV